MKKMGIILAAIGLSATLGHGGEKTFSLSVSGGMTRLAPYDLNAFLKDYAYYYVYYLYVVDPSYNLFLDESDRPDFLSKKLQRSSEFEITLLVRVAPGIFLTFGSGFISAGLESDPLLQTYGDLEVSLARTDRVRAVPIRVGLLYSWLLSRRLSLRPHVSLDAYLSSFEETGYETRKFLGDDQFLPRDEWDIQTRAVGWGSTWGLSLDLGLSKAVNVFLDGGYRRARLGGYHWTETRFDDGRITIERDFRLLYYGDKTGKTGFRFLNLPMACVFSPPLGVVRDAVLDLSGPYLKGGLRVSF